MPVSINQLVLSHVTVSIATVDRQFCLSAAQVHTQQWISVLHLQYHKVLDITYNTMQQKTCILQGKSTACPPFCRTLQSIHKLAD